MQSTTDGVMGIGQTQSTTDGVMVDRARAIHHCESWWIGLTQPTTASHGWIGLTQPTTASHGWIGLTQPTLDVMVTGGAWK